MQDRPVRLEPELREDRTFLYGCIADQLQRLICMRRQYDMVEPDIALTSKRQDHPALFATQPGDAAGQMDMATISAAKAGRNPIYLFAGPAFDRTPDRAVEKVQQFVIFHELQK